ncbi:MAG: hypothetical protein KDA85_02465, partial [Planctomycetaceae bacterium]|nr:hypothetical protein [Planctomycetaceae bacterium]
MKNSTSTDLPVICRSNRMWIAVLSNEMRQVVSAEQRLISLSRILAGCYSRSLGTHRERAETQDEGSNNLGEVRAIHRRHSGWGMNVQGNGPGCACGNQG